MTTQPIEPLNDRVYVVQVLSLFSSVAASMVMAGIFALAVYVAYDRTGDTRLLTIGVVGGILNVWRIAASMILRKLASEPRVSRSDAARFEALFAVPYISFAVLLGIFGFIMFHRADPELHMLTICVAVGYCAGVASTCGMRLPMALGSILLAIGPIIVAALMKGDEPYTAMAIVAAALIGGATRSMIVRLSEAKAEIATRISSVSMARRDVLTALPNRLALDEFFAGRLALSPSGTQMAVHYLDLDGFKPVNDQHGHAVGDQVLLAVARRLRNAVRQTDMVARLGGDEFAIVQFGLKEPDEAYALAWRVRDAIQQPFRFDDALIAISTSVGTVVSTDRGSTLDDLLQSADAKLYDVKRAREKLTSSLA